MKYLKSFGIFMGFILFSITLFSLLNYNDVISNNSMMIIILILVLFSSLASGFYTGKNSKSKGYLEGVKTGLINVLVMFLFTIIFSKIKITSILYYLLIVVLSVLGSILGINKKKIK